jgi:hypothetical protein
MHCAYLWTVNKKDMKTTLATLLIISGLQAFAQEDQVNKTGFEFRMNNSVSYIYAAQMLKVDLTGLDGRPFHHNEDRENAGVAVGLDLEFGYRFHNKWSAGAYAGAGFIYEGFYFILPWFDVTADAGFYGRYHANDRLTLTSTLGVRMPPVGNSSRSAYSLGFGTEYAIGKRRKMKFRWAAEAFYGRKKYSYHFIEGWYDESTQTMHHQTHQGVAPQVTTGFSVECGLAFQL